MIVLFPVHYSDHNMNNSTLFSTLTIWISDVWYSNGRFVSGCQMVVWKPDWKSLFVVQNVWYLNGPPSHMTLPFEYRTPMYSDGYCIYEFSICQRITSCQMWRWGRRPCWSLSISTCAADLKQEATRLFKGTFINDVTQQEWRGRQWRFEIWTCQGFKWSIFVWFSNGSDIEWFI